MSPRAPRTPTEFRRFVAQHHPDRGGEAEAFAAGVAAWRAVQAGGPPVVFYRRLSRRRRALVWLRRILRAPLRGGRPTERRVR